MRPHCPPHPASARTARSGLRTLLKGCLVGGVTKGQPEIGASPTPSSTTNTFIVHRHRNKPRACEYERPCAHQSPRDFQNQNLSPPASSHCRPRREKPAAQHPTNKHLFPDRIEYPGWHCAWRLPRAGRWQSIMMPIAHDRVPVRSEVTKLRRPCPLRHRKRVQRGSAVDEGLPICCGNRRRSAKQFAAPEALKATARGCLFAIACCCLRLGRVVRLSSCD